MQALIILTPAQHQHNTTLPLHDSIYSLQENLWGLVSQLEKSADSTIVYVPTIRECEEVHEHLSTALVSATTLKSTVH